MSDFPPLRRAAQSARKLQKEWSVLRGLVTTEVQTPQLKHRTVCLLTQMEEWKCDGSGSDADSALPLFIRAQYGAHPPPCRARMAVPARTGALLDKLEGTPTQ